MNRRDNSDSDFDVEVTLVDLPPELDGVDPLALFESESESESESEGSVFVPEDRADAPSSVLAPRVVTPNVVVPSTAASSAPAPSTAPLPLPAPAGGRNYLSLAQVLRRLGHVEWLEAVAIVESLCKVLEARGSLRVPGISAIALTPEGTVEIGSARMKEAAGPILARMLHTLAATESVPAPLRLFITKWASTSGVHSIGEFARDLAYFTRPDGQACIRAVYLRALAAVPVAVKSIAEQVHHDSTGLSRRQLWIWLSGSPSGLALGAAAAIVGLGLVTALFAMSVVPERPALPPPPQTSSLPDLTNVSSALLSGGTVLPMGSIAGEGAPWESLPNEPRTVVREAPVTQRLAAPGTENAVPPASSPVSSALRAAIGSPGVSSPGNIPAVRPASEEPANRAVRMNPARAPRRDEILGPPVFSRSDPDVVPPVFLSLQLPGQVMGGVRPEMNTIELVVSETGTVERVRLLSTPRRMADMMLLSGAKNWEFKPALKDGQAVRYRLELSWTAAR